MTIAHDAHASIVIERLIEWSDTDASGHVHNAVANRLLEAAEAELLRRLGLVDMLPRMPRVRLVFEYRSRLYFGDRVNIHLRVRSMGVSSLTWEMDVATSGGPTAITAEAIVAYAPGASAEPWPPQAREALLSPAA